MAKKIQADHGEIMNELKQNVEGKSYINIKECPIFRPTTEEFRDFSGYLDKCVKSIGNIGLFKVS